MTADETPAAIPKNEQRRVVTPLPFGCLSQPAWLPLHLICGGLVIEMEFDAANTAFAESGADWIVQDVSLMGTLHEIDSSLAKSYASHVLNRKSAESALRVCRFHQTYIARAQCDNQSR